MRKNIHKRVALFLLLLSMRKQIKACSAQMKTIDMKNLIALCLLVAPLLSCSDDPSKPTDTGFATMRVEEQQAMQCPYCMGNGVQNSYYGTVPCQSCQGKGERYNISFREKEVKTLIRSDKKCPVGSSTFECVDESNNGVIPSTDKCIHCKHLYYVHE